MNLGVIPETWIAGTACFGIATGVSSAVLWKPLMKMQDKSPVRQKPSSDFIGLEFILTENIGMTTPGSYRYSGIDWRVEIDVSSDIDALAKGDHVVVVTVEVGVLSVIKK